MYEDDIIYGRNKIERIVSIEVNDSSADLFIEDKNGNVTTTVVSNRFWLLAPYPLEGHWSRLQGDLHYRYGKQFKTKKEYFSYLNNYRQKDVYSLYDDKEALMIKDGYTYFKGMKHDEPSILSFDIEATSLDPNTKEARVLLISNTHRKNNIITKKLFAYDEHESEQEMIQAWCAWVRDMNPSLICGHNIYSYDLPYLNTRTLGEGLPLGRDGSICKFFKNESAFRVDGSRDLHYHKVRVYGREIVDTMFLAYRYDIGRKYDSYGLKPIIKTEGLEEANRTFYDASQIRFNYKNLGEWAKIKEYARDDADDALKLYDLMAPAQFYFTVSVPKPFQTMIESATGSQLNSIMVRSYLQTGHSVAKADTVATFQGAISWGNPGIYRNVQKLDVSSLYPSICIQYEIFSREKDPKANFFHMLKYFREERLRNKRLAKETNDRYYSDLEQSEKIAINSAYGLLGAPGLNYNYPKGADQVTSYGREILNRSILWATGKKFEELITNEEPNVS